MLNLIKSLKINKILFISWIINFFLIGKFISPIDTRNLLNIEYLVNIRGNLIILSILLNILVFICLFSNQKKNNANLIAYSFLIFLLTQTLSYYLILDETYKVNNYNLFFFLTHIFFIFSPSLIIINILLINNNKLFQNIIKFSITSVALIIFFIIITTESIKPQMSLSILNFETANINANGFSRLILLIYFFILIIFIEKKISFLKKNILLSIIILINYFLLTLQSRTAIILAIVGSLISVILNNKSKFYKNLITLTLIFIIPLLIYSFNYNVKDNRVYNLQGERQNLIKQDERQNLIKKETSDHPKKEEFFKEISIFSTGRTEKWKFITELIFNNKSSIILGFGGPQTDRLLFLEYYNNYQLNKSDTKLKKIKQISKKKHQGQDISNGLLYSIITAGIFGFFIYSFIVFLLVFILYKLLVNTDKNYSYFMSKDIYFKYSLIVTIILILRSFVENGFMVWGVDQIFFIMCSSYIYNYYYSFKLKNL